MKRSILKLKYSLTVFINLKNSFLMMVILSSFCFAQVTTVEKRNGIVTYRSSQNIYVKFESAEGIKEGDSLFINVSKILRPAVIVKYLSSQSCAGEDIYDGKIKPGDTLYAFIKKNIHVKKNADEEIKSDTVKSESTKAALLKDTFKEGGQYTTKKYSGRLSVYSYSSLSNLEGMQDYQQWRYSLSFNSEDIFGSGISFSNYSVFYYKADQWSDVASNPFQNLRVYNLKLSYKFNDNSEATLGRFIGRHFSSIGPVDGIQYEKPFGNFSFGIVAGSRPDLSNMGLNAKLFEVGGVISRTDSSGQGFMENSVALFQQTNNFKIDRRFLYFQHTNSLIQDFNVFVSSEFDLYKKERGIQKNDFSLTGLYVSARYNFSREFSLSLSYDARKNVVYYETYKSFIDSLIDNEMRQGLRASAYIRPFNMMFIGLNAGYSFVKGDVKPSSNFGGYLVYSQLPFIGTSLNFNYNRFLSNYTDGSTWGISTSKNLFGGVTDITLGYKNNLYSFSFNGDNLRQNIFSVEVSNNIWRSLFLSISYEGTFEKVRSYTRFFTGISSRF